MVLGKVMTKSAYHVRVEAPFAFLRTLYCTKYSPEGSVIQCCNIQYLGFTIQNRANVCAIQSVTDKPDFRE
jgi:hypothetical protein